MHSTTVITASVALISLIFVSAFFSSSETGMMAANRYRLRHKATSGDKTAARLLRLLERPDRMLGVILLGNTLANIIATSLATMLAVYWFGAFGVLLSTVIMSTVILICAEIIPKTIAALHADFVAFMAARPLSWLLRLFYPAVWVMNYVANSLLNLCGMKVHKKTLEHLTVDELRTLVHDSKKTLPAQYHKMLSALVDLEHTTAEDIMIPRHEIQAINLEDDWNDIVAQLRGQQHRYLPLYTGNIDNVSGILDMHQTFYALAHDTLDKKKLAAHSLPPQFIPETAPLAKQLAAFKKNRCKYGLVVDEYGKIRGFITLTDILEEIVGEFAPDAELPADISPQADGSYLIAGSANIRELNREMNWSLPESEAKTLSGLIIEHIETMPQDDITVKIDRYCMEVLQVKNNRINTVKLTVLSELPEA